MTWLWHSAYFVLLIILAVKLDLKPYAAKDSPAAKRKKRLRLWLIVAYVFCFPVLNLFLFADRTDLIANTVFQFITAAFFNVGLFIAAKQKTNQGWEMFIPALVFLPYAIVKNFIVVDGFFLTLLAQLQAILTTGVLFFIPPCFFGSLDDELLHGDEIALHKDDWAVKPRYQPSRQPRNSWNTQSESKKAWTADSWEKATTSRYNPIAGSKSCKSCRYYDGGFCTNAASGSYNGYISDAAHHSCFLHNK